jgi:predicted RNA binding protein YcfA (HicA-like mRNA interferase family)
MKVDRRRAEKSLKKKGFSLDRSGDHPYYFHKYEGKETGVKTYVSHSGRYKDIGPDNLESMRRQLKFDTKSQAIALLECPMDKEAYNEWLVRKGFLRLDGNN